MAAMEEKKRLEKERQRIESGKQEEEADVDALGEIQGMLMSADHEEVFYTAADDGSHLRLGITLEGMILFLERINFVQFSCCLPPCNAALYAKIASLPCFAISTGISDDEPSPSSAVSKGWSRLPVFSAKLARRLAMQSSAVAAIRRAPTPAPAPM